MTRYLAVVILLLCCQVVGANPDNMESWRKRLGAPTESTRQAAISQLIELGPGGWTWFQALADDSNPRVRAALSNGLGLLPDRVSRPILEKFLEDPDGAVRAAAVRCLLLDSPEPHVAVLRQAAASNPSSLDDGLRYWTAVYVHRELDRLLPEDHFVLGTYPKMFKRLAPLGDWVKNPLLRIIRHPPRGRRSALANLACEALGQLKVASARVELYDFYSTLDRHQRQLKESVAVALFKLGETEEVESLLRHYRRRTQHWGRWRGEMFYRLGQLLHRIGATKDAVDALELAHDSGAKRRHAMLHYNLACLYTDQKKADLALHNLQQALKKGLNAKNWIARDRRLDPLRADPRFRRMLQDPQAKLQYEFSSSD